LNRDSRLRLLPALYEESPAEPVPGAALDAVNWARNVNIHEIQAANGGG